MRTPTDALPKSITIHTFFDINYLHIRIIYHKILKQAWLFHILVITFSHVQSKLFCAKLHLSSLLYTISH